MPVYLSPGVYIEEQDKGTKPIESVGTATAAFIGFTEKAEEERDGQTVALCTSPSPSPTGLSTCKSSAALWRERICPTLCMAFS